MQKLSWIYRGNCWEELQGCWTDQREGEISDTQINDKLVKEPILIYRYFLNNLIVQSANDIRTYDEHNLMHKLNILFRGNDSVVRIINQYNKRH